MNLWLDMTPVTASTVADFFLTFCQEHGDVITHLKLQKLVYYAQAWHLALKGKPLFEEQIEAWVHGPVTPSVYSRFKKSGWAPISVAPVKPALAAAVQKHLIEVFSVYGHFSAWDLERMTHQEEPWQRARAGLSPDQEGHQAISQTDMQEFYRKLSRQT